MKYAYLDTAKILHITKEMEMAKKYCRHGGIVSTAVPARGGYPIDREGNAIIMYSATEARFRDMEITPELQELYRECEGQ